MQKCQLNIYEIYRCKNSLKVIERSLLGHYKEESLFALKQSMNTDDRYQNQIKECDAKIELKMQDFEDKSKGNQVPKSKREAKKII